MIRFNLFICATLALFLIGCATSHQGRSIQQVELWHALTLDFMGQQTDEEAQKNPFLNYRLDVTFTAPSGKSYQVPGFFAADGNAAETSAKAGNVWRARFSPGEQGVWHYRVSFVAGENAAIDPSVTKSAGYFDGETGVFSVVPQNTPLDKKDFRLQGALNYVGEHYLQFAGSQKYFLKAGANSPETFLGFVGFDDTPTDRTYDAHVQDWQPGDVTWQNGKGKGIIGMTNYLASLDNNSFYFLLMNIEGDGKQVWPFSAPEKTTRYDVSKLAQWALVFDHMSSKGIMPHFVLTETENEHFFEWHESKTIGGFADSRKLYYRELVARFGYLLAVTWNMGEESGWADGSTDYGQNVSITTQQRKAFAEYVGRLLWRPEHISIHNGPSNNYDIFLKENDNILGDASYTGISIQGTFARETTFEELVEFRRASAQAGRPWVSSMDEPYTKHKVLKDIDLFRANTVWSTFMGGGAGVELYLGGGVDLHEQDLRNHELFYKTMAVAKNFFMQYVPFWDMRPVLGGVKDGMLLQQDAKAYLAYLPKGGAFELDLPPGSYSVLWFAPADNQFAPQNRALLVGGEKRRFTAPQRGNSAEDWVCLIKRAR